MNPSYSHILTLVFKHEYFEDGFFRSLDLSYAEDTLKIMRDLDIIVKPFKGGLHLLSARPELLALNSDTNPLQFYLSCKDPYYINYTVLPSFKPSTHLVYFNNLDTVKDNDALDFRLHEGSFVKQKDILRLSHGIFQINGFDKNTTYSFKHAYDEAVSNQSLSLTDPINGQITIMDLPAGMIRVFDGAVQNDAVYYYPKAVWNKPMGTIEIYTQSLANHCDIREVNNNGIKKIEFDKVNYSINFKNQKTYWKYFLISDEYQRFNDLTIINKDREQIFHSETDTDKTWVLTSRQTLPLSEHPTDNYQLVNNFVPNERTETVILKNLVAPSPEQLHRDDEFDATQPDETLYSHIYL